MSVRLYHPSLSAHLNGACPKAGVWQFRNLQYATIPARFASPEPPEALAGSVDCTAHGPICPQNHVDFRHLLRIPEHVQPPKLPEDEFQCLNLDVTTLEAAHLLPAERLLPVLLWIHGGSQAVSFGTNASGLCDTTNLVKRSLDVAQPVIVVTINYRVNMFAFGDLESDRNLALKDQQMALKYVRAHISGFGGDPEKITIAGESAGAVFCHAHLVTGASPRQCILQSGTLHLSPPQSRAVAENLINRVSNAVKDLRGADLRTASVSTLLKAQATLGLESFFLQEESCLEGWQDKIGDVGRLLIGDCEYESVLWRNGIEACTPEFISEAFDAAGEASRRLKGQYGIIPDRPVSCKLGALDFLNDARFSAPIERVIAQSQETNTPVFRFLVDQPNPWQSSSRAHHGVDLIFLFGGYDLSHNKAAEKVSLAMQEKWIKFINGGTPWQPGDSFAFGPVGICQPIDEDDLAARRRQHHMALLADIGPSGVNAVVSRLAAGRSSLLN
ncbi:Alpha/Beta hydrolase protein [Plectosphaerella plurivora]|uniref:Carboxylic ester hydrolase n=1 Tax=Plectosphaerella plurivora TaxID=936078 RepID=A0A9P9A788_9PEZI|nr:Alpha/Beta hydrolase protein [Plectosphaerella plurivora]